MTSEHNGWSEYEKLVLYRLGEQSDAIKELSDAIQELKTSMAITKVKLAFIGMASGSVGSALVYALMNKLLHL